MYKVFVNDCPIILTDNNNILKNFKIENFNRDSLLAKVKYLLEDENEGIQLLCSDLEESWSEFQSLFKVHKAGGGKVLNSKNEVLFIYRFDKWDLPKGKLEEGETIEQCAFREVEEECGMKDLTIQKELETTYHIFQRNDEIIFKITYWFLMHSNYKGELSPQTEEGIEEVVFKNEEAIKKALDNSYENIRLLF